MPAVPSAVAVDAGGTTTRAVVVTRHGHCGQVVRSGRGNPVSDPEQAATSIVDACEAAIASGPHETNLIVAAVAGTVSRDFPELPKALHTRGMTDRLVVVSDLLGAYFSATAASNGYVMILGTGAVAARIENGQLADIRDGLGWLLGDSGSGFWLGQHVARAVAAELDCRGPSTSLTPRVIALLSDTPRRNGVRPPDLAALLTWSQSRSPMELAELGILAAEEAGHDDVAADICSRAAKHALGTLASLIRSHTDATIQPCTPVVLGGSVLRSDGAVGRPMHEALHHTALAVSDGVAGAALLAVREMGGTADDAMLAHIKSQLVAA